MEYDVVVIGAGHAGVEAALASARLGLKIALVNFYHDKVSTMPCNPSIGGPAKGIVVREIDALGGQMGVSADACAIQLKLLNSSKGPGVWAIRAQIDKLMYSKYMKDVIINQKNIDFIVDGFFDCQISNMEVTSVLLVSGKILKTKAVIFTIGTYSSSVVLMGDIKKNEGPSNEITSDRVKLFLDNNNIKTLRFKTGTPPRVKKNSIDLSKATLEPGTDMELAFSSKTKKSIPFGQQQPCYLIRSTLETKKIIENNLNKSAMYSGKISSIGPRYCPSFEDKIVRFKDKDSHQIFLEPESLELDTFYVQGLSTSMPINIQEKMLKSLPGFESVIIDKWAYAIEYDCIDPMQLDLSLSLKKIRNLFFAGQINGTSGYEEAAGQGLMAGINASLLIKNKEPLILKRSESYIGLMIDDLVNKGVDEPYRLLTSRAEYRLHLRNDNAEKRLKKYGYEIGLINERDFISYKDYENEIEKAILFLKNTKVLINSIFYNYLKNNSDIVLLSSVSLYDLLKQPRIDKDLVFNFYKELSKLSEKQKIELYIIVRFEGYLKQEQNNINKMLKQESKLIPHDIDYEHVDNIANEAKIYLSKVRPISIAQAARVRGVNPPDIQMLLFYLKNKYNPTKKIK
ncbi:tRNA uridine-5-carboxymethylaminomethyl(34) synthesis enzyme MnmG [Spiroplasma endosymbiont of Aspidapion aeneum]|uniref:tRNA uridine-5-carboxymethylaminomethyl(34) synthesis enzyme MnmG n=1 Tax=Spiroplasma endosymbiont of Aspidapion aeneum TaxID=3066276 RepID=UPI00313DCA94